MNSSQSPLFWSFPLGNLLATRIRISIYFPLLLLALLLRLDPQVALALTAIFLFSTLMHELAGHILVARWTGGQGDEVLLWPIGGLAWVQPANTFASHFLTAAAGPFVNLMLCLVCLPTLLWIDNGTAAFSLFTLPIAKFSAEWGQELILLIFYVNWALTLINLLPIYPLDGGRMLEACLSGQRSGMERKLLCLKIGTIAAIILIAISLGIDQIWMLALAAMLLVMNILETVNVQHGESYDDSFMGYDFSQGYTSLEKDEQVERPKKKSYLARRKEEKEKARLERELEQRKAEERELDLLLDKVHREGVESLSIHEKKFLERASKNFRTKNP